MPTPNNYVITPSILTQGDTSTPSVIKVQAEKINAGNISDVDAQYSVRCQVCNDDTFVDSTNATIAATTGYGAVVDTHQATKDLTFASPKSAAATGTLTISGVVVNGETVTIDGRVYEFSTDGDIESGSDYEIDISADGTQSQGTLTMATKPTATDTVTVGSRVYTFVAAADAEGEVTIGADVAASKLAIVAAINGTDHNTANPQATAAAFSGDDCVITAIAPGVAGDSIITTETFTDASDAFDAATLGTTTAGVDVSATDAGDALVAALAADTSAVVSGSNATGTVTLTADTAGVAGNALTTTEAMANGAFGAGTMSGGSDTDPSELRISVTDASAETVTLRFGVAAINGLPADGYCTPLQLTHAAP